MEDRRPAFPVVAPLIARSAEGRKDMQVPAERLVRRPIARFMESTDMLRQRRDARQFGGRVAMRMQHRQRALNEKNQRQPSENGEQSMFGGTHREFADSYTLSTNIDARSTSINFFSDRVVGYFDGHDRSDS